MEENITKRNVKSVTIAVVGHNINNISEAFKKSKQCEYSFTTGTLDQNADADLIVLAVNLDNPET